ncbi:MAG: tetratricopeptide repeat protein, partial [Candidatus Zixiibacteriota bacterium]
ILGVASGCATLILLYQLSRLFFPKREWLLPLLPPLLLTASSAFAYWSISGLETSLFTMMVLLSVYLYLTYPRAWGISCAVSALVRPEGVLVFGILLSHQLAFGGAQFKKALERVGGFLLLLLPFVVFKIFYYGDILPNPFYAKTGFSFEYLKSGLEYFWLFLTHYGLWGIVYVAPVVFFKRLNQRGYLLMSIVYLYTLYVIVIGGDVLKVHRFFMPVLPLLYLLLVISLRRLFSGLKGETKVRLVSVCVLLTLCVLFFLLPYRWMMEVRVDEKDLVDKMRSVAEYLAKNYGGSLSLAVTTIGSVSYYAGTGTRVIDMLGLTDKHIARNPEEIEGIPATWKEKRYNTRYVLSQDPDFIFFPTGYKPSAPAERALVLNSKFRDNYYVLPVVFEKLGFIPVFKKKGVYAKENSVFPDPRFVDLLYQGVHLHMRGKDREAIEKLKQVIELGPEDFALAYELLGRSYFILNDYPAAERYLTRAVEIDDRTVLSHVYLWAIYQKAGRSEEAEMEKAKVYLHDPYFRW